MEEIKGEKSKNSRRILDSDDDSDDGELKNKIKQEPEYATSNKSVINKEPSTKKSDVKTSNITFSDLVKMQKGDLLFVQFPDHLPGSSPDNRVMKHDGMFSNVKAAEERMDLNEFDESLTQIFRVSLCVYVYVCVVYVVQAEISSLIQYDVINTDFILNTSRCMQSKSHIIIIIIPMNDF